MSSAGRLDLPLKPNKENGLFRDSLEYFLILRSLLQVGKRRTICLHRCYTPCIGHDSATFSAILCTRSRLSHICNLSFSTDVCSAVLGLRHPITPHFDFVLPSFWPCLALVMIPTHCWLFVVFTQLARLALKSNVEQRKHTSNEKMTPRRSTPGLPGRGDRWSSAGFVIANSL